VVDHAAPRRRLTRADDATERAAGAFLDPGLRPFLAATTCLDYLISYLPTFAINNLGPPASTREQRHGSCLKILPGVWSHNVVLDGFVAVCVVAGQSVARVASGA
jgi:hypothetical protein